ncbi:MAG: hypothetical protein U1E77_13585 [Inhella sp.]
MDHLSLRAGLPRGPAPAAEDALIEAVCPAQAALADVPAGRLLAAPEQQAGRPGGGDPRDQGQRADLLGELRRPAKSAAYAALSGQTWFVLAAGIAEVDEATAAVRRVDHLHATHFELGRPALAPASAGPRHLAGAGQGQPAART